MSVFNRRREVEPKKRIQVLDFSIHPEIDGLSSGVLNYTSSPGLEVEIKINKKTKKVVITFRDFVDGDFFVIHMLSSRSSREIDAILFSFVYSDQSGWQQLRPTAKKLSDLQTV